MYIRANPNCAHVPVTFTMGPNGWPEDAFIDLMPNTDTNDLDVDSSLG